jgi:hypothetical protein
MPGHSPVAAAAAAAAAAADCLKKYMISRPVLPQKLLRQNKQKKWR